ncbi:MAG TPA: ParB/RepB/Spo0J family partition protein [Gemmatimonadales bacterium]|nr:ParB/RepB/Spo0J family partition protein [Gemmatimonadales bacterium]
MSENRRLGRGLEALLGPVSREQAAAQGALRELPVASVKPNPYQPRTRFDEAALTELADSIQASGLLQPVVVRGKGNTYELIAGERRWRAVQRLGWKEIPAVVKEVDDRTLLTLALIENLQRNDLSAIDEAIGYHRMMEEFRVPQAEVARLVGRNRSTVANLLRLLKLPPEVQTLVHEGALSEGHARALLALEDGDEIVRLARQAVAEKWSVRETEARVRGEVLDAPVAPAATGDGARGRLKRKEPLRVVSADVRRVEDALRKHLGTDVRVTAKRRGRGLVTISYYSNDDLARLLELIMGEPFGG